MVAVPVGDQDMRRAADELVPISLKGRIAGEERIDQNGPIRKVEAKRGMAEPGNLH
jgi:hypothetical protein